MIWAVYEITDRDPFPSPADFFYLAGYPLVAAGLLVAVRRHREARVDRAALIDAAIVTVISTLLAWIYLIKPVIDDPELSGFEGLVTILYPLGDLVLFAVATRFVMASSWNVRALRLLVGGLGLTLVGDVVFNVGTGDVVATISSTVLLVGIVLIGGAALDPTIRALDGGTRRPIGHHGHGSHRLHLRRVPGSAGRARRSGHPGRGCTSGRTSPRSSALGGLAVARLNLVANRPARGVQGGNPQAFRDRRPRRVRRERALRRGGAHGRRTARCRRGCRRSGRRDDRGARADDPRRRQGGHRRHARRRRPDPTCVAHEHTTRW